MDARESGRPLGKGRSVYLEKTTWPHVAAYLEKGGDFAVLAVGSLEEHGRHNPLGTDNIAPNLLLDLMDERLHDQILIAPTVSYGNCDDLVGFPGTLTIGYDLLRDLVARITDQLFDYGVRRFLIVNGHGPNIKPLSEVCESLNRRGALAGLANWWLMAGELNPAWGGGHGGAEETAAVMAADPSLVDTSAYGPMDLVNDISDELPTDGWSNVLFEGTHVGFPRDAVRFAGNGWIGPDDPTKADPEWGTQMMQGVADCLVDLVGAMQRAPLPKPMPVRTYRAWAGHAMGSDAGEKGGEA